MVRYRVRSPSEHANQGLRQEGHGQDEGQNPESVEVYGRTYRGHHRRHRHCSRRRLYRIHRRRRRSCRRRRHRHTRCCRHRRRRGCRRRRRRCRRRY
ncbi:protamine-2 [Otolemur garnettii]|uniref:protamine-2 n=1 Tax=Otolemur garnettii TaxID=30611 RepID=UPI0006444232|nr:protamine-2 [Otolemur garnettii]